MTQDELDAALLEMLRAFVARAPLFAELRARGEADDVVQDALIAVASRVREGAVVDPFAYATRVVQNLARRAYARERPVCVLEAEPVVPDVAEDVERRFELAEVLAMVRAVTLVVRRLTPEDVELVRAELRREDQRALARRLGLSRATFYRRKRDAVGAFVWAVARGVRAEPCAEWACALLAAASGSGFASARGARAHAEGCRGCATTLRYLAAARHGLCDEFRGLAAS